MAQREAVLSRKIKAALQARGAFAFKVHGSEHMMAGLPDLILCYRGHFVGMEVKHPETRTNTSERQKYVHGEIKQAGGQAFVVCGVAEALRILEAIDSLIGEVSPDSSSIDSDDPKAQGSKRIPLKETPDRSSRRRIKRADS